MLVTARRQRQHKQDYGCYTFHLIPDYTGKLVSPFLCVKLVVSVRILRIVLVEPGVENRRKSYHQKIEPSENPALLAVSEFVPDGKGVKRIVIPNKDMGMHYHCRAETDAAVHPVGKDNRHSVLLKSE